MFRLVLMVLALLVTTYNLYAQTTLFQDQAAGEVAFAYGFKGGVGLSLPDADYWNDGAGAGPGVHSRVGIQLGVLGLLPFNKYWSLRTGLDYAALGYSANSFGSGTLSTTGVRHNYIHLPMAVQYNSGKGSCLYTGFTGGYMIGAADGYKRGDVLWSIGGTWISTLYWGLDARYSTGLVNIAPDKHPYFARMKNKTLQLSLIFLFAEKK